MKSSNSRIVFVITPGEMFRFSRKHFFNGSFVNELCNVAFFPSIWTEQTMAVNQSDVNTESSACVLVKVIGPLLIHLSDLPSICCNESLFEIACSVRGVSQDLTYRSSILTTLKPYT